MGSFDVMVRLAKQAVDYERQALQEINAAIAEAERQIDDLAATARSEANKSVDFMTVGATLSAYLQANKRRSQAAAARIRDLQEVKAGQLQKLQQKRVELKRYEQLAERRAKQKAKHLADKEQKAVDELLVTRQKRSCS